jgi:hypothetical protein
MKEHTEEHILFDPKQQGNEALAKGDYLGASYSYSMVNASTNLKCLLF